LPVTTHGLPDHSNPGKSSPRRYVPGLAPALYMLVLTPAYYLPALAPPLYVPAIRPGYYMPAPGPMASQAILI
jgi:hypothetical protein